MSMFKRFQWHSAAPHFTLLAEGAFVRVAHWPILDSVLLPSQLYQRCSLLFWPVQCKTNALPCLQFFWKWQLLSPTQRAELLLNDTLHLALTCNFRVYLQFLDASTGLFRNGCLHSHHTHTTFRIRYTPPLLWRFQTINQDFQTY